MGIEQGIDKVRKAFGKDAITVLEGAEIPDIPVISTGSLAIDLASGVGGFPLGRIVEIYGPESCGKTTIAMQAIRSAQEQDLPTAFIDAEHAYDLAYSKALGIDNSKLYFSQPDSGEQALQIAEYLIQEGFGCVVIDSVAALVPQAEIDGDMGEAKVGLQARLMSQACRKLTGIVKKSNCCLIFLNQTREKIGVMFGNPTTTSGGNALKFYATMRIELYKRTKGVGERGAETAISTMFKFVKNKVAPPFRRGEILIEFGKGTSLSAEILEVGAELGVVEKRGAYYYYGDTKIGQGLEKAKQFLNDNPPFREDLLGKVQDTIRQASS